MKALFVFILMLTGCATKKHDQYVYDSLFDIRSEINKLHYYIEHDKCFTSYAICKIDNRKDCWKMHEDCVIAVYRKWMELNDK